MTAFSYEVPSTEYRVPSTEYRVPSTEYRVPSTESGQRTRNSELGTRNHQAGRRTFTLIEAVISILIVSTMLVAALGTVGAARRGEYRVTGRARALALAQSLMGEILQQAYADADFGPASWGIGADELTGTRRLFDDVDDYIGWEASPPQNKDGSVIPGCDGYAQAVSVDRVDPNNLTTPSGSATGVKRIEVTIRRQGDPVVTLVGYRTVAWIDPGEWQGGVP